MARDCIMCVVVNKDQQVWSKMTSGRLPSLGEVKELIDNFIPSAQIDSDSF